MRRLTLLLAFFAFTHSADAATLVNSNGRATLTATSGERLDVTFDYGGQFALSAIAQSGNRDPITATGCTTEQSSSATFFSCNGVSEVVVVGGAGDDSVQAGGLQVPLLADGGSGRDFLVGGNAADTLTGGAGDDTLYAQLGDTAGGGAGVDHAVYQEPRNVKLTGPVTLTLDGVADDGHAGSRANFLPDVEDLDVGDAMPHPSDPFEQYGPITLVGSDAANHLIGANGPDTITGGGGIDVLEGRDGDDTLLARDGLPDRVRCGAGTDTALVDPFDVVSGTCEHVEVAGERPTAPLAEDHPPTIAWGAGRSLEVAAADDRGIAHVRWLDGARQLCEVTVAPYACTFTPTVADVGAKTIVAIATDSAGQTSSVVRVLTVPRFEPSKVTLQVRGRVASGKVTLPAGVPCAGGKVAVGGKTVALRKDCTYRVTVKRAKSYVAKYLGTPGIATRSSKRVRA